MTQEDGLTYSTIVLQRAHPLPADLRLKTMHFALVAPKQLATDAAVRDALQSTFEGSQQRVAALVAALQDPGQRVAVRRACPPSHAKLLAAAEGLVQQQLASISAQQVS